MLFSGNQQRINFCLRVVATIMRMASYSTYAAAVRTACASFAVDDTKILLLRH
jgi:hypothetical protein